MGRGKKREGRKKTTEAAKSEAGSSPTCTSCAASCVTAAAGRLLWSRTIELITRKRLASDKAVRTHDRRNSPENSPYVIAVDAGDQYLPLVVVDEQSSNHGGCASRLTCHGELSLLQTKFIQFPFKQHTNPDVLKHWWYSHPKQGSLHWGRSYTWAQLVRSIVYYTADFFFKQLLIT